LDSGYCPRSSKEVGMNSGQNMLFHSCSDNQPLILPSGGKQIQVSDNSFSPCSTVITFSIEVLPNIVSPNYSRDFVVTYISPEIVDPVPMRL
jgi:hypothetical protein